MTPTYSEKISPSNLPNGNRTDNLAVSTSNALLLSYSRLVKIIKRLNDILTSLLYFLFLLPA